MALFRDRADAGRQLAAKLERHRGRADTCVLALPDGLPVALEISRHLHAPLDVLVAAPIGSPESPDESIGAVVAGGMRVVDGDLCDELGIPGAVVRGLTDAELADADRRDRLYHRHHRALEIRDRSVILVDDGMAAADTLRAALAVIARREPARITIALPVASFGICASLAPRVDEVVLGHFRERAHGESIWSEDARPQSDEEIRDLLDQAAVLSKTRAA